MRRIRVIVRGQVQGVGFRMNARQAARELRLTGSARNLPDGSVEVEVEGADDSLERMLAWLDHGPTYARVDSVEITEIAPQGDDDFVVS